MTKRKLMKGEKLALVITGSDTSKAASEGIAPVAYSLRERIRNFIVSRGRYGATREEASRILVMKHQTCSARCNELIAAKTRIAELEKKLAVLAFASVDVELAMATDLMELGRVMAHLKSAGIETTWADGAGLDSMSPAEGVQILAMQLKSAWLASGAAAARGLGGLTLCEVVEGLKKDQKEMIEIWDRLRRDWLTLEAIIGSIKRNLEAQ